MIRTAILGAGIGREHLIAYRTLIDQFEVALIVDQDTNRAEGLRESDTYDVSDDIATALADPSVDVIDVCLPPHLHVPVTIKALEAGKHVICEKPLATSLADVRRIMNIAEQHAKQVFPVFQYRWAPAFDQLRHLIRLGLAGQPRVAAIETHWNRGADYYAVPWRGTWAGEQGGAVLGHAIHNHDILTHFMGPVVRVAAMTTTRVNDIETEDCAAVCFEMQNGALATSSITLGAASDESRIRLVFEHMTATSGTEPYAPGTGKWNFTARNPDHQIAVDKAIAETPVAPSGFAGFLAQVAKAVNGEPSNVVTLSEGASSVELVTAIYHAARTRTYVELPLSQAHSMYEGWHP